MSLQELMELSPGEKLYIIKNWPGDSLLQSIMISKTNPRLSSLPFFTPVRLSILPRFAIVDSSKDFSKLFGGKNAPIKKRFFAALPQIRSQGFR